MHEAGHAVAALACGLDIIRIALPSGTDDLGRDDARGITELDSSSLFRMLFDLADPTVPIAASVLKYLVFATAGDAAEGRRTRRTTGPDAELTLKWGQRIVPTCVVTSLAYRQFQRAAEFCIERQDQIVAIADALLARANATPQQPQLSGLDIGEIIPDIAPMMTSTEDEVVEKLISVACQLAWPQEISASLTKRFRQPPVSG